MNELILKSTEVNTTSIIPNFGAVMKMGKTFMYNEFLKYDDGKLAKFIAEEKGIDEAAAKEQIAAWVETLQNDLDAGKTVTFEGVGELVKVDGKLKFTAKPLSVGDAETPEPVKVPEEKAPEPKKEEKPKEKTVVKKEAESKVSAEKPSEKEKKGAEPKSSLDFKAKEVVEKVHKFTDKNELIAFTRGDSRKTVVAALNEKLDELNGKKKSKPAKEEPKEETKSTEVKPPKNVVTEVKQEPKEEPVKPVVPPVAEKPNTEETPKKEEKKSEPVKPVVPTTPEKTEKKPEPKEEKKEVEKPKVKVEEEKTIKEKAAAIEKPQIDKKEEDEAIAAIVSGVEQVEKEQGKRKKRWILWVALLLILIGGGTVGYLKKDMIMGWFDKEHEPKDLAEGHEDAEGNSEQGEDNSTTSDEDHKEVTSTEHTETEHTETSETETEGTTQPIVEDVEEPEPVVEEPEIKETPVINSSSEGDWHIVAGSYSSQANAENKVEKLKAEGYSSAKVLGKYNGLYTVRVSSFTSKEEAKAALESFTNAGNKGFIKKL